MLGPNKYLKYCFDLKQYLNTENREKPHIQYQVYALNQI